MDIQIYKKAVELRRAGESYSDIAQKLKISRSLVCAWLKNYKLSETEKYRLHERVMLKKARAKLNASITIKAKRVYRDKQAFHEAERTFEKNAKQPFFMFGLGMTNIERVNQGYKVFQFNTSNIEIARIMLKWFAMYAKIDKKTLSYRLSVAKTHENVGIEHVWSKRLGVEISCFSKTTVLHNSKLVGDTNYNGSICISIAKARHVRMLIAWQKLTIMYYS